MAHILLRFQLRHEDGVWIGDCVDLDVSSFGSDIDEAFANALDAAIALLNTLEALDDRERFFIEHGVALIAGAPTNDKTVEIPSRTGEDGYFRTGPVGLLAGVG